MTKTILAYIRENLTSIVKIAIIYGISIVVGIMIFNFSSIGKEYIDTATNILDSTNVDNFNGVNVISSGIKNNLIIILTLMLSTFLTIYPFISYSIISLKGIATGLYISTCFKIFGFFKGIEFVFIDIIVPQSFNIFGIILCAILLMNIYTKITKREKIASGDKIRFAIIFVFSLCLISFSIVFEQLISPICINIYTNIN